MPPETNSNGDYSRRNENTCKYFDAVVDLIYNIVYNIQYRKGVE